NLVVQAALIDNGLRPFRLFEFALLGIPLLVVGTLYMVLVGRRLIKEIGPRRRIPNHDDSGVREPDMVDGSGSRRAKWISGLVLLGKVAVMAGGWIPISIAALAGAVLIVILGCLSLNEAIRSVEWSAIFLFSGMLALSDAMAKTGADRLLVNAFLGILGPAPHPAVVLGMLAFVSWLITQVMPNTASAAILAPVGLAIAGTLGIEPHAVVMAVAAGATCALSTPIGTPPNVLVYGASGYRFVDYLKVGIPLSILLLLTAVFLILWVWPTHGA
ncbi:anion permease, partial [Candidatus Bipolaricaulota bacterium]|nr:anion permease [Candidatus Bipolaricaulota bacterium]